ncbi:choice-of-anchor M domain-containing protein [Patulibacter americanus]|uniref:choice-of-anchor M domain-containing protein n=1 Tax=Patulibacter americanus TaxID=588672 RepID=UPI0003B4BD3A|nr:choice-of-anchor M domain-containing protein [Patulibacter americanus]
MTASSFIPRRRTPAAIAAVGASALVLSAAGPLAATPASAATTISSGHVDAVSGRIVKGRLRMFVKDGSTGSGRVQWRDPSTVVLRLNDRAKVKLPGGLSFVGPTGSSAWLIPQVQRSGVVWAGWNTEELSTKQLRGPLRWSLRKVTGPGRAVIYQTGSFGDASVLFSSAKRFPQSTSVPLGVHVHGNWAFTKRGTYRMSFALQGTSRAGRSLKANGTLRVRVG